MCVRVYVCTSNYQEKFNLLHGGWFSTDNTDETTATLAVFYYTLMLDDKKDHR